MNARSFSLSIIIPTKNRELTLGELLESLRGAANIGAIRPEVIVANNGSDDGTDDFTANAGARSFVGIMLLRRSSFPLIFPNCSARLAHQPGLIP